MLLESRKNIKFAPSKIIKYEDLIANPENTFISILNFLKNFMDIDINKKKITNVINSCSFEALSDKEEKDGFSEAATHKISGKKLNTKSNQIMRLHNVEIFHNLPFICNIYWNCTKRHL